jgi:hypothetical protein
MTKTCMACGAVNDSHRIVCNICLKEIERVPGRSYLDRLESAGKVPSSPASRLDDLILAPCQDSGVADGEYTITVRNDTSSLASFAITARGDDSALRCELDTGRVTLAAGTAACVRLTVRSRPRLIGDPRHFGFQVEARGSGAGDGRVLHGTFVQQPLFRSVRPLVAAAALLIGASGFLVTRTLQPVEARVSSANIKMEDVQGDRVDAMARGAEARSPARTGGNSYLVPPKRRHRDAARP